MRHALFLAGATLTLVSGASGCVTVAGDPPAGTDLPPSPSADPAPPDREGRPRHTPGPARETLARAPSETARPSAPGTAPTRHAPPPAGARSAPPSARPAPERPRRPPRERAPSSDRSGLVPGGVPAWPGTDVCGLGETYGGWDPGSAQARACREVYGD
ncbi:hypothetical protein [Streptomyces megasporus]|uniref:hypothetical protein n=1 Tax=Streptomyces megasporus TaxID=44060 RepID=UPI001FE23EB7|nr:hypothetical protein [Streptomyces megasporus]